jgi:hypothetical protein
MDPILNINSPERGLQVFWTPFGSPQADVHENVLQHSDDCALNKARSHVVAAILQNRDVDFLQSTTVVMLPVRQCAACGRLASHARDDLRPTRIFSFYFFWDALKSS